MILLDARCASDSGTLVSALVYMRLLTAFFRASAPTAATPTTLPGRRFRSVRLTEETVKFVIKSRRGFFLKSNLDPSLFL